MNTTDDRVPRSLLVILRFHLGVILLITVLGKLLRPEPFSVEMLGFIHYAINKADGITWYQDFLRSAVIPHATLFSYMVMAGELAAAISFLFGFCTRAGAAIAMLLFVNFLWAKGRWFWSPDSEDAAVFFEALVVMLGAAGRKWGVDGWLARRWPRQILW